MASLIVGADTGGAAGSGAAGGSAGADGVSPGAASIASPSGGGEGSAVWAAAVPDAKVTIAQAAAHAVALLVLIGHPPKSQKKAPGEAVCFARTPVSF
jgi:hypothetical protein